jgi:hypothetical protein
MNKIVILFAILCFSQFILAQNNDDKVVKAQKILQKSRETLNSKKIEIKSISLTAENVITDVENDTNGNIDVKFDFLAPNKIYSESLAHYTTNEGTDKYIYDGKNILVENKAYTGSQWQDFSNISTPEENINQLKKNTFYAFFPIFLDAPYFSKLDFAFIGMAQSKDGRANILEATAENNRTYRIFIDEKTNLLLMMVETWKNQENKQIEKKFFYSDYKEFSGIKLPTKIKIERSGKLVEERTIKSVKINPQFKANLFEVKK